MEQAANNPYQPPYLANDGREPHSPETEHERQRLTYQLCRLGFGILSGALVLACFTSVLSLIQWFTPRGIVHFVLNSQFFRWVDLPITWGSLIGVYLLWARWNERSWQRRSGLLLLMSVVDAALWFLSHANEFGLHEGEVGHKWVRFELGQALGWAEFTLMASLACDLLAHLGVEQAPEAGKATRSLSATGAVIWMILFLERTDWRNGWPLRDQGIHKPETLLLTLGTEMIWTIALIQVTALTIAATRQLRRVLKEMDREDREHELLKFSSEADESPTGKKPRSNRDPLDW